MSPLREWAHVAIWLIRHLTHKFPQPEADRLRNWLPKDSVCVDLGAHGGVWTVPLSRLVPQGEVVAFEALPYNARILRRTVKLLGLRNAHVINQAVCDEEKPIHIVWQDPHGKRLTGLTHILGPSESAGTTITVQGTTLDSYFAAQPGQIRFIKMDIEGAELSALRGATQVFEQHRPIVYSELNASHCVRYGYQPADVFQFYNSRGYRGFITGPNHALVAVDAEQYVASGKQDVWFIPEDEVAAFVPQEGA